MGSIQKGIGPARGFRGIAECKFPATQTRRASSTHLKAIVSRLLSDPTDRRPLGAWAKSAGTSSRTLARAFRNETGLSFGAWRRQLTLMRALELLARGKSVTEVALALRYESTSAFIQTFRRHLGTTPARYFAAERRS